MEFTLFFVLSFVYMCIVSKNKVAEITQFKFNFITNTIQIYLVFNVKSCK